jgi:hypothetical protein
LKKLLLQLLSQVRPSTTFGHISQLNANNVFLLEQMLTPMVFGMPQELKSDPEVRAAVITILDALVDAGSAAAYLMRDDFATPLPAVK